MLHHEANLPSKRGNIIFSYIYSIDEDSTSVDVVILQEKVDDRTLSTSRVSNQSYSRTRADFHVEVFQKLLISCWILKTYILKFNFTMSNFFLWLLFSDIARTWLINDFKYSFCCFFGLLLSRNLRHSHGCSYE
jgi:hypothetical protein